MMVVVPIPHVPLELCYVPPRCALAVGSNVSPHNFYRIIFTKCWQSGAEVASGSPGVLRTCHLSGFLSCPPAARFWGEPVASRDAQQDMERELVGWGAL